MSTITDLNPNDTGAVSRSVINANFDNLNADKVETSVLDTDVTLAANSDTKVATQKAVKTYTDSRAAFATSGVSAGPASSSTQTITHGLGKIPSIIRLYGYGRCETVSSQDGGSSSGVYSSSGNTCVYVVGDGSGVTVQGTSTTYSVYLSGVNTSSVEVQATGVVQNVTSTTFDIVWTASATVATVCSFLWEAQ